MKNIAWLIVLSAGLCSAQVAYKSQPPGLASGQPSALQKSGRLPLNICSDPAQRATGKCGGTGNLVGFWDAYSVMASGVGDGGQVSSWPDNSPHRHPVNQTVAGHFPTLQIAGGKTGINPSVKFVCTANCSSNGVNAQWLQVNDDTLDPSLRLTCPFTIFVVVDGWNGDYYWTGKTNYRVGTNNSKVYTLMGGGGTSYSTTTAWEAVSAGRVTPRLHIFQCEGNAGISTPKFRYFVNGAQKYSTSFGANNTGSTDPFVIGGGSCQGTNCATSGSFGSSAISAVALYNGVPTATERQLISRYFTSRYNIPYVDPAWDADRACGDAPDSHAPCPGASTFLNIPARVSGGGSYASGNDPGNGRALVDDATHLDKQVTHPSILYFPSGWGGHKYWMAYTPYDWSTYADELPNIAYSDDGNTWTEPMNGSKPVNPLSIPICNGITSCYGVPAGTQYYLADTELAYNDPAHGGDGKLYLFFREGEGAAPVHLMIEAIASSDGIHWTGSDGVNPVSHTNLPYIVWSLNITGLSQNDGLSPSVTWDDNLKLWVMFQSAGINGPGQTINRLTTTQANFPMGWSGEKQVRIDYGGNNTISSWHQKILWSNGLYYGIFYGDNSSGIKNLWFGTSTDGLTFQYSNWGTISPFLPMVARGTPPSWSDSFLYRPTFYRKADGNFDVFYGGVHRCQGAGDMTFGVDCSTLGHGANGYLWHIARTTLTWPGL